MATLQRRSRGGSPAFHADDFVGTRQYDKDLERFEEMFREIQKGLRELVPREEHERIWQANENRFSRLETKIDIQFDEIGKNYTPRREFDERVTRIEGSSGRLVPWIAVGVSAISVLLTGATVIGGLVIFVITHGG